MNATPTTTGHVWHAGRLIPYTLTDHRGPAPRPRILVVVPCYNAERWVPDCLASLAANDEPHDVLLIDDGSREVLRPAPADNLSICRFEVNAGVITARNYAASFARDHDYAYYVPLDADDLAHPDRLRRQRVAIEQEGAVLSISGVRAIDAAGATLWTERASFNEAGFRRLLASRNPSVHSTWFFRTDAFVRAGCYDERFKGAEDYEFLQRLADVGDIAIIPDPLVDYRVHATSALSISRLPALQTVRIIARGFHPLRPGTYFGVARAVTAAAVPRGIKTAVRQLLWRGRR